jgi:hypothetical protein
MIVYKRWKKSVTQEGTDKCFFCEGWFLFRLIPLLVKEYDSTLSNYEWNYKVVKTDKET